MVGRLVVGLFIAFSWGWAQNVVSTIQGKVVDSQTQAPIGGVFISVYVHDSLFRSALSDTTGFFKIDSIPVGYVRLKAQAAGYEDLITPLMFLHSGKALEVLLPLEEKVVDLEEVVIQGEVYQEVDAVSAQRLSSEQLMRQAGGFGDVARIALSLPGVNLSSDSRNDIIIRGNSPLGVLWRLEGFNIPPPQHFNTLGTTGGAVSILNANLLQQATLYTGAWPALYNNATAGVFDLVLREGNNQKHEFLAASGFNGFEIDAEGPLWNSYSTFLAAYRYSTLALFKKIGLDFNLGATPEYQDLTFKIAAHNRKNPNTWTLFGIAGNSQIQLIYEQKDTNDMSFVDIPSNTYYKGALAILGTKYTLFHNSNWRSEVGVLWSLAQNSVKVDSVHPITLVAKPAYGMLVQNQQWEGMYRTFIKWRKKHFFALGFYWDYFLFNMQDSVSLDNRFVRNYDVQQGSSLLQGYAQWEYKFSSRVKMQLGVSGLYFDFAKDYSVDVRWSLYYRWKPRHSFRLGLGKHAQIQPVSLYFRESRLPDGTKRRTNERLKMTQSLHGVLAYTWQWAPLWRLHVEVYYQYLYRVPVEQRPSPYSALNEGATFVPPMTDSLVNKGIGYNYGVDLLVERSMEKGFYFQWALSLFRSLYEGSDGVLRPTAFSGDFLTRLTAGKIFRQRWVVDARWLFGGNRRYIPIDLTQSRLKGEEVLDWNQAYQKRYPNYFRIDLRLAYRQQHKNYFYEAGINLQNLTNHKNVFQYRYNALKGDIITEYQMGLLPVGEFRLYF